MCGSTSTCNNTHTHTHSRCVWTSSRFARRVLPEHTRTRSVSVATRARFSSGSINWIRSSPPACTHRYCRTSDWVSHSAPPTTEVVVVVVAVVITPRLGRAPSADSSCALSSPKSLESPVCRFRPSSNQLERYLAQHNIDRDQRRYEVVKFVFGHTLVGQTSHWVPDTEL